MREYEFHPNQRHHSLSDPLKLFSKVKIKINQNKPKRSNENECGRLISFSNPIMLE